jgi:hypothetical protein
VSSLPSADIVDDSSTFSMNVTVHIFTESAPAISYVLIAHHVLNICLKNKREGEVPFVPCRCWASFFLPLSHFLPHRGHGRHLPHHPPSNRSLVCVCRNISIDSGGLLDWRPCPHSVLDEWSGGFLEGECFNCRCASCSIAFAWQTATAGVRVDRVF